MKNQIRSTPIAYLPGRFCASLAEDTVFCTWKDDVNSTLIFYFLVVPDDPEVSPGFCRNLACLEFDYSLNNIEEARAVAGASWDKYQQQILAVNGDRLAVTDLGPDISCLE